MYDEKRDLSLIKGSTGLKMYAIIHFADEYLIIEKMYTSREKAEEAMKRVTEVSPYYGKYPETLEIEEFVLDERREF